MFENETIRTSSEDNEEEKNEKQKEMHQGKVRGHINIGAGPRDEETCREHKEFGLSKQVDPSVNTFLRFSARNSFAKENALENNLQMTQRKFSPTNENNYSPSESINQNGPYTDDLKIHFNRSDNILYDNGVAYPPPGEYQIKSQTVHQSEPRFNTGVTSDVEKTSVRSPLNEKKISENTTRADEKSDQWSCNTSLSRKLSEENLEFDSLRYDEGNQVILGSFSCPSDTSSKSFQSSEWMSRSFNLIDFTSKEDGIKRLPSGIPDAGSLKYQASAQQKPNIASELMKSLQVVQRESKQELTTDGPTNASKLMEQLTKHVIPEIQRQDEEINILKKEILALRQENNSLRESKKQLNSTTKQSEETKQSSSDSFSSQTHVVELDRMHQAAELEHYSIQVSESQNDGFRKTDMLKKIQQLQELNQKLYDANDQWATQWDNLQKNHKTEIEGLNQIIRTFKEQDTKRQEEFDKILLTAKRRQNDEEIAKEEALGQLAQMTGRCEELEAQYGEIKNILEERTREKNIMETELLTLRMEKAKLSENALKAGVKKSEKKLVQQHQTEIAVLKEQLKLFQEDFGRERLDRERAQSEKDQLNHQMEHLMKENKELMEKTRIAEHQIQTIMGDLSQLERENSELKRQIQKANSAARQYQQGTARPFAQTTGYPGQHMYQTPETRSQYPKPKAQPETDPYAQPLPPYLIQPNYGLYPGHENQRSNTGIQRQYSGPWNCAFCTYSNHPQRTICEICGTHKGKGPTMNGHTGQPPQLNGQNDICIDSGGWQRN